ncbi:MAG: glutathione S-transferase family protein [Betaproteobacteria bacterium]|nr:glutathione S-transferase family protein [Betaproteobacteria bacterium]
MIDLYTWPTPNGHKIHIMLEETGTPYRVIPVDIGAGDQFKPEFLKISPNNKMPALVDSDGPGGKPISVFESGAMLIYLASKTGRFLPEDLRDKWSTLQWLMFQMGGVGPMLGQAHHFLGYAPEKIPYAMNRYSNEANRLYGVIDRRLRESKYIACGQYTIADMAIVPWLRFPERQGVRVDEYPALKKWRDAILARPAVQKAMLVLAERRKPLNEITQAQKDNLFGAAQYAKR